MSEAHDSGDHTPPLPDADARWALFLDIDGTLLEFADTPDGVRVAERLPHWLAALHGALHGALALVSGRGIDTIDRLFAPHRGPAAGLHGLERRDACGHVRRHLPDARALADARAVMEGFIAGHPAALVEDKGGAIALHFRREPGLKERARHAAERALAAAGEGFHLQPGDCVFELKPLAADKGAAIAGFLEEAPFRDRLPVFVGDDVTDEHGFDEVNRRGGISVLVGDRAGSAARYRLRDPQAVHDWLCALDRRLEAA